MGIQLRLVALNEPFGGNVHGIRGEFGARSLALSRRRDSSLALASDILTSKSVDCAPPTNQPTQGADFECKREAAQAQVRGSFRALLATSFQNLNEVVRYPSQKYPIANLRVSIVVGSQSLALTTT